MGIACGILDKLEPAPYSMFCETHAEISVMYKMITEFEMALSLMKKTLRLLVGCRESSTWRAVSLGEDGMSASLGGKG